MITDPPGPIKIIKAMYIGTIIHGWHSYLSMFLCVVWMDMHSYSLINGSRKFLYVISINSYYEWWWIVDTQSVSHIGSWFSELWHT